MTQMITLNQVKRGDTLEVRKTTSKTEVIVGSCLGLDKEGNLRMLGMTVPAAEIRSIKWCNWVQLDADVK